MRLIPLSQGKFAFVDDADYEMLSQFKWYYHKSRGRGCAVRKPAKVNGKRIGFIWMHRVVAKPEDNMMVDHINGNTLDNRKENLRVCTRSQNQWNKRLTSKSSTGLKNIYYNKSKKKFVVRFQKHGKKIEAGLFLNIDEAIAVRNKVALTIHEGFNPAIKVSTSA